MPLIRTESPYPMLPVAEARDRIMAHARPLEVVEVETLAAVGLALAEDVRSDEDVPPAPRSSVDGYAVRAADGAGLFRVLGEITAGHLAAVQVVPGTAARIMTGGYLPSGADAVVMVEQTVERDGYVEIRRAAQPGENVHRPGQDIVRGQLVLPAGAEIGAPEIGLLATLGRMRVRVRRRPRVAVLATGDELVEPTETPPPGFIRDANRYTLLTAAREAGAEVVWSGHARDDEADLEAKVRAALDASDVLLTSGGVSMGTRDLIKPLLEALGQVHFGRVNFKPGKPLTFATVGPKLVFGLPGFPVSSLVTFEVFVRPALRQMAGHARPFRPRVEVELLHDVRTDPVRPEYQRAVVSWSAGRLVARTTGAQTSSRLLSLHGANALLELPAGGRTIPAGERVPALLTGPLVG
jgi:molybdopterin molybdotransferase